MRVGLSYVELIVTIAFICCCIPFLVVLLSLNDTMNTKYYQDKTLTMVHAEDVGNDVLMSIPIDFGGALIVPYIQNDFIPKGCYGNENTIGYHWTADYGKYNDHHFTSPITKVTVKPGWESVRHDRFKTNVDIIAYRAIWDEYYDEQMYLNYNSNLGYFVCTASPEYVGDRLHKLH